MKKHRCMLKKNRIHIYTGWFLGILTFILYLFTASNVASFWDSAEFIATAVKLQVGHPPGAPFYILLARVFSVFSMGNSDISAFMVNLVSIVSASFTIVFTYYAIILLLQRIIKYPKTELNKAYFITIVAAFIGSLSLAVSFSFWNAATEAEVYSLSLLLTSIIFWAVLKWDAETHNKYSIRWIFLIMFLLGISIGTHLLGLLCLPAIILLIYFKTYNLNWRTTIIAVILSIVSPIIILYLYIPLMLNIGKWIEIFAVNSLSLPANTGLIVFILSFFAFLGWGIYYSLKKRKKILHITLVSITMLSMGFSSYALVIIRSNANPPIDENNPENIFNLISYVKREQYGSSDFFYGQVFNSKADKRSPYVEGKNIHRLTDSGYEVAGKKLEPNYLKRDLRFFPRMWSQQAEHIPAYITWSGAKPEKVADFKHNLKFFISYQTDHMYLRYFMWNFAGKQNDFQGHGTPLRGNWLSGINFIDKARLGISKKNLGPFKNAGTNTYYFLPLILGLIGVFVQFKNDKKGFWVLLSLFIFTGFAIVVYLNQTPFQPRERDYSFLGSFYAFSIWIAIGTAGMLMFINKLTKNRLIIATAGIITAAFVPGIMLAQNIDDCNRSNQTLAEDLAYNILNTCAPNAILFTNGDNDTFPLWYLQEVKGIRTDVRVVNMSYLNMDWYIDQCKQKQYDADPVPISVQSDKYIANNRDYNLVNPNFLPFVDTIYAIYQKEIDRDFKLLCDKLMFTLDNSDFPELNPEAYKQVVNEFINIRPHVGNQRFLELRAFIMEITKTENIAGYNLRYDAAQNLSENMELFIQKQATFPLPLGAVLDFVFSDDDKNKINTLLFNKKTNYVPGQIFRFQVDANQLIETGTILPENIEYMVPLMQWKVDKDVFIKSDLIVLDIIRTNNWERPIYFVSTAGNRNYLGLEKYFTLEGMAYRLIPQITPLTSADHGTTNPLKMYENITQKYQFNGINNPEVYLDENMRIIAMNMRNMFTRAARDLYFAEEIEKAKEIIDLSQTLIPNEKVPYDYFTVSLVHAYYRINHKRRARELASQIAQNMSERMEVMLSLDDKYQSAIDDEELRVLAVLQELKRLATEYEHKEYEKEITSIFNSNYETYARKKGLYENKP
jgi:hypothetical protein